MVGLVHALGVGDLPDDGLTLVVGHRHADRDLDVFRRLDGDLLADLLGQNLAAGLVVVGPRVMRAGGSSPKPTLESEKCFKGKVDLNVLTMHVSVSHSGVTDPLVDRMTLGLIVKLKKGTSSTGPVHSVKTSYKQYYIHRSCVGSPWYTFPRK